MPTTTATTTAVSPFADLLAAELTQRGITNAGLARTLGIHRSTVGDWLRGGMLPSRSHRAALAVALNIDPALLHSRAAQTEDLRPGARRRTTHADTLTLHPSLATALATLAGLDWEAQTALALLIQTLLPSARPIAASRPHVILSAAKDLEGERGRQQEANQRPGPARPGHYRSRAGATAEARGEEPPWTRPLDEDALYERLRNQLAYLQSKRAPIAVVRMLEGSADMACDEVAWAVELRDQAYPPSGEG